jgi:hypothetical protein
LASPGRSAEAAGAVGATVLGLVLAVRSYRDRFGWGFGLLRIAWMLPVWVTLMAVFLLALRVIGLLVRSGSVVLMAAAGAALVGAAWRSRGVRAFLNRAMGRPKFNTRRTDTPK